MSSIVKNVLKISIELYDYLYYLKIKDDWVLSFTFGK